jgi:flavin reductase (DIM6/NTAB) family NADH-FMN oxidoreductase RutF
MTGPRGLAGFTATSVTSLSAEPPLVSFGVATTSSSAPAMLVTDTVLVHLLGAGQAEIAVRFAAPVTDRFSPPVRWTRLPTGEPLLADTPAWLRGRVEHRLPAGDHYLVIARVVETKMDALAAPLVYHDGRYATVTDADQRPEPTRHFSALPDSEP